MHFHWCSHNFIKLEICCKNLGSHPHLKFDPKMWARGQRGRGSRSRYFSHYERQINHVHHIRCFQHDALHLYTSTSSWGEKMWDGWKWGEHVSYLLEPARHLSSNRDSNEMCIQPVACIIAVICSIYFSVFNACIVARVYSRASICGVLQCSLFSTPTCENRVWNSQQSVLHILEVEVVLLSLIANTSLPPATFACSTMQCSVMEATPGIGEGMARSH